MRDVKSADSSGVRRVRGCLLTFLATWRGGLERSQLGMLGLCDVLFQCFALVSSYLLESLTDYLKVKMGIARPSRT